MILSILDKIRAVITISDEEYRNLKKLEIILKCIMELNPKKENAKLYIHEGERIVKNFIESFQLTAWNYCHLLTTHMKEDMISLQKQNLSIGMFSISRIEMLVSKLKRIMKYYTNHNWGDRDPRKEHCLFQTLRYYSFVRSIDELKKAEADSESEEEI